MNFFSLYKRKFLYKIRNKINIDTDLKTSQNTLEDLFAYYGTDMLINMKIIQKNDMDTPKFIKVTSKK